MNQRILLVEDSRTQAIMWIDLFERQGWLVDWAPTVDAAMQQLNCHSPDVIIVDYYLPEVRGDELCRLVRMNIDTRNIPVLMLTMDETHRAELKSLESGADDFVSKSLDPDILLARIRTLLNKSRAHPSIFGHADHQFRRARLLTIDDSPTYQQFLTSELSKEGYQIEIAMSGREGLDRLLQEPFDCALVDLVMPELNGIELCRHVSEARLTSPNWVMLLMLTGRETKEDLTQALEAGADDFVGKSSDMAVLKGRIRALLRRKFFQQENRRIAEELKQKEVEMLRARSDKEMAEARAALNDELEQRVVERTAELAEANRNLEQKSEENAMFVYSVSHDMRSPLVNLQGFGQELELVCHDLRAILSQETLTPEDRRRALLVLNNDIRDNVHHIHSAVLRLSNIIDALLRLCRAGRVEYQPNEIDIHRLVKTVIASMSSTVTCKAAEIIVHHLDPAWGDSTAIEQLFANLIGNALKYLEPERRGLIEIGQVDAEVDCRQPQTSGLRTYYVKDNGLGICDEYHTKLFQAFKRFHADRAEGDGMGLAIVRRIVERHHGKVWVQSAVGLGTTFYVSLPASRFDCGFSDSIADTNRGSSAYESTINAFPG